MAETFKTFEKACFSRMKYKDMIDYKEEHFMKVIKLLNTGTFVPFPNRDAEGRRFILFRVSKWDTEIFTAFDIMRTLVYCCLILLEEEETQIAGISYVFDVAGLSASQLLTPKFLKDGMDLMLNCSPIRYKDSYVMNLPSIGKFVLDFVLSMIKGKLSMRVSSLDNSSDLKNHIDSNILPKEYGGTQSCDEMLDKFLIEEAGRRSILLDYLNFDLDFNKIPFESFYSVEEEGVGSFRKLDID